MKIKRFPVSSQDLYRLAVTNIPGTLVVLGCCLACHRNFIDLHRSFIDPIGYRIDRLAGTQKVS